MADQRNNKQNDKTKLAEEIASRGRRVSRSYASFEVGMIRFFRFLSSLVDRFLFSNKHLFLSSFLLAVVLVGALNFGDSQMLTTSKSAESFENIKVQTIVNNEIYEVKGIPDVVSALVIGEISDLQLIQSSNNLSVVADLSGLGEGTHSINLRPVNYSAKVDVKVNPATAIVTIARKVSRSYYFDYEFINKDKADPMYVFSIPDFSADQVFIRASEETLNEIAQVKALIDVSGVNTDFTQEAKLVAFDQQGIRIEADIIPEKIEVSVQVSTPKKTVPVEIQPIGEIPDNKSISSITLDNQSITIYAPNPILDKIESVVIPLDVSKLVSLETQGTARVILPSGVRKADIDKVHFTIKLGETVTKTLSGVRLEYHNYDSDSYKIAAANPLDTNVEVVLNGTKENIDKITANDIRAYLDLSTITIGRLSLPVIVVGPDYLVRYAPVKANIDVEVVGS